MTQTTKNLPNLRLLVLDVDGTLTDGSICMGPAGEVCKLFSVKDGLGIQMLAAAGVQMAVITGRTSEIVARHGGTLEIESKEGRGTAITVRLPVEGPKHD